MSNLIAKIQVALLSVLAGFQTRVATRRAAGFLEYAMLALAALAIFAVISKFFIPEMNAVFDDIVNTLRGARGGVGGGN